MIPETISIENVMATSNVRFGTSGARGLVTDMTDRVCYAYTSAFIQHMESAGELGGQGSIAVGGDLRSSTDRVMKAVAKAVEDRGYTVENCGKLPSPALAYYGLERHIPTVMVTGSHIPEDRNGIKYNKRSGEILKKDEAGIKRQLVTFPEGLFDSSGMFVPTVHLPPLSADAAEAYKRRYLDAFPNGCLKGKKVGVYQHSSVGRELMVDILSGLGADVTPLGISRTFIPVDTEAIRPEDSDAALRWSAQYHFDSIVSADGDGDRPLISDEHGKWLRGDVAGIICASYLRADTITLPVSCNTAVDRCGLKVPGGQPGMKPTEASSLHLTSLWMVKLSRPFLQETPCSPISLFFSYR
jgi:phosphomannomutase